MRRTAEHGPQKRFAAQVIKRFESAVQDFAGNAATIQRDALLGELAKLAQCWQAHNASELAKATDDLFSLFQRAFRDVAPEMTSSARSAAIAPQATTGYVPDMSPHTVAAQPPVAATPIPQVTVESHDDKAWRDTLLKVAAILCERQPGVTAGLPTAPPCAVANHHQYPAGRKRWPDPTGSLPCRYDG